MALVLDTGPLYAAMDSNDRDHRACLRLLETATEVLVIPAPVLVEVDFWINSRMYPSRLIGLLNDIEDGVYRVEALTPADYRRVREICAQYDDSAVGFVDAAVLAVVERLNEPKLVTLDHRHFRMLRPRHVDALRLLPDL